MIKNISRFPARNVVGLALASAISMPNFAQTSVSVNVDYVEGRYGEAEKSTTWTMPLIIRHQMAPVGLKLYVPYVRASGVATAGGDRFTESRTRQEGLGDIVTTISLSLYETEDGNRVDIGAKTKFASADKRNDLITTGKNDYSLFVDLVQPVGKLVIFGSLGMTKKGDPGGVDYRDPGYASLGISHPVVGKFTAGLLHDYRQKVTQRGAPVSESTIYVERKIGQQLKMQFYFLMGHSTASPDQGAGATITWIY